VILDVERFVDNEEPYWKELEKAIVACEIDPRRRMSLEELERFHYLYQRAATSLARLASNSGDPEVRAWLESLIARAYGEIHRRPTGTRFNFWKWLSAGFPQTLRRHAGAFWLSLAVTIAGSAFGAAAIAVSPEAKATLMPFEHLMEKPHERVAREEKEQSSKKGDRLANVKGTFSAELMTHNIRVAVLTLAMGMTWGVGVITLLFYNGVSLGAVASDYVLDGQTQFLMGWLMPHGVIEIPAILIAGQAGLLLALALIGRGTRAPLAARLREISGDLATLIGGVGVMLVWAGFIEAFLSQYHEPVIPYGVKIAFGFVELILLGLFLARSGANQKPETKDPDA